MASLPSVAVTRTPKSESEFRKYSASFLPAKSPSVSYQRSTQLDGVSEARCLDFREALSFIREGTKVESAFYVPILQECIDKKLVSDAQKIHAHIVKTGAHKDAFLMTFLVNVYAKCGTMETARKVFDELPRRNVVSWTTLMTGYVHDSKPELAVQVFREMLEAGAYPTNYTLGTALSASSDLHSKELGKQIHGYSIKYRIEFDASIGNSLCSLYSKCGSLECAVKAFRRIRDKNVISWTTVISAWGDNGEAATGLQFFVEMLSECVEPNEFTLTSALSLCCVMQSLDIGTQIHSLTIKLGLVTWNAMIAGHARMMDFAKDDLAAHQCGSEALSIFLKLNGLNKESKFMLKPSKPGFVNVVVGTALVNMYNKCGSIERASKAFVEMSIRTLISWTSMITGYAQNGQPQQALLLFEDMRLAGVRPNKITFAGRSQGKLELGFYAAEQLLNLKPKDTETYNLLLNMIGAGLASRTRFIHSNAMPGHMHRVGEMYELLGNLHEKAKSFGYEWEESFRGDDEEEDADEEKALTSIVYHSEKLAIAFGLLNTSNAVPIRVTKSISMCRDCHNFIRIISLLSAREIIIRDSKRLHKFINGHCSCGDFGTLI
ncbi:putative pentatricopeptide repeat-containing protein [Vitis vinifera]|uniref:Putative pentatricopeptide repeat-containing protein n=1 Tax=Vitis vinifera TaxID=29760 RepID=A0A438FDU3_VITVI|nr:putative pentatricopeptide repeat-containing protein [Vitis vinifera]